MGDEIKVLMTGAGSPGGPGIIQALKKDIDIDLYIADANPNASGRYMSNDCPFYKLPKASDNNFIDFLLDLCIEIGIDVIFPLVTRELFELSTHKQKFLKKGIKIIVSDKDALFLANNKCSLYNHLKDNKIQVPEFYVVNNKSELAEAAIKLNYGQVPIVVKPCIGNGSRGMRVLDGTADRFDLLFNQKPSSIFTTLEEVITSIGDKKIPRIVVSEYLPGDELTIDTIVNNGELVDCLIRKRTRINNGISTAGNFVDNKEIYEYVEKIVSSIPMLDGPIGFQVKKSAKGKYLLLESNPRIQGTSVAALGLGVNLPQRAVNQALGITLEKLPRYSGISFVRYYQEAFYDS
jgi:carbamoyl-phosphate synthase large subunit